MGTILRQLGERGIWRNFPFRIVLSCLCLLGSVEAQSGNVEGVVQFSRKSGGKRVAVEKYTGKITGLVNPAPPLLAGVWLTRPGLVAPAKSPDVHLAQKGYQFAQSLLVVPVKTKVFFPNEDPDYHNVYSLSRSNRFDIGRYLKNERPTPFVVFEKPGIVRLNCEIHEHMRAHVLVVDSPYHTRTNERGRFQLNNIPVGTYVLYAQLDKKSIWKSEVEVTAGQTQRVSLGKKQKQ